jgi:superfamily II DNA helicase RecQ
MRHLGIPTGQGLMALPVRRDNLQVSVHTVTDEEERRKKIVSLVKDPQIVDYDANPDGIPEGEGAEDTAVGLKRPRESLKSAIVRRSKAQLTIVYVWRRFEADSLAEFLKGSGVTGVAVYHAGIDASTRARTQLMFDRGKVQCIVATVAFGMGVDKADVRQVIHCTMPKSIESYMQVSVVRYFVTLMCLSTARSASNPGGYHGGRHSGSLCLSLLHS